VCVCVILPTFCKYAIPPSVGSKNYPSNSNWRVSRSQNIIMYYQKICQNPHLFLKNVKETRHLYTAGVVLFSWHWDYNSVTMHNLPSSAEQTQHRRKCTSVNQVFPHYTSVLLRRHVVNWHSHLSWSSSMWWYVLPRTSLKLLHTSSRQPYIRKLLRALWDFRYGNFGLHYILERISKTFLMLAWRSMSLSRNDGPQSCYWHTINYNASARPINHARRQHIK
jgi:hypothetical protein